MAARRKVLLKVIILGDSGCAPNAAPHTNSTKKLARALLAPLARPSWSCLELARPGRPRPPCTHTTRSPAPRATLEPPRLAVGFLGRCFRLRSSAHAMGAHSPPNANHLTRARGCSPGWGGSRHARPCAAGARSRKLRRATSRCTKPFELSGTESARRTSSASRRAPLAAGRCQVSRWRGAVNGELAHDGGNAGQAEHGEAHRQG